MATMNKFPPDVPKDWDEATDEAASTVSTLRAKASNLADKASETVRDGYDRAVDAVSDIDPVESGKAVIRAVERHPAITFGLGALSVGLIAWSALRQPEPSWRRYEPDYGRVRRMIGDYAGEASQTGEGLLKSGERWLRSHGGSARDYAEDGGRMIARRAGNEPIAALLGVGIAIYVLGSMLSSQSEPEPARKRAPAKR